MLRGRVALCSSGRGLMLYASFASLWVGTPVCCCALSSHPSLQGIDLGDDIEGGRTTGIPTEKTSLLAKVIEGQPGRISGYPDLREEYDMTTQL